VGSHGFQDPSVVDTDGKAVKVQFSHQSRCSQDHINLCQESGVSQNVNVTLHKLTETASLRTVCPQHISDVQSLERLRQFIGIIGIEAAERNGKIVAKTAVYQIILGFRLFNL